MWDATAERCLIEQRTDAVLLVTPDSMEAVYLNVAAQNVFSHSDSMSLDSLLANEEVQSLLQNAKAASEYKQNTVTLSDGQELFCCALPILWEEQHVIMLTLQNQIQNRAKSVYDSAMTLLSRTYFTVIRIDVPSMEADVISAQHPLLSAQAHFNSFQSLIAIYAESVLHPADREEFLATFSQENLLNFVSEQPVVELTVRRLNDGLYSWAKFSLCFESSNAILFLGADINDAHLELERTEQYQQDLKTLSLRNSYILSSVSDIFRLMLHVDIRTGEAVICALHPSLSKLFSYDKVYVFEEIANQLLSLVHPDDVDILRDFSDLSRFRKPISGNRERITLEYRRISPQKGLDTQPVAKWTRSVVILTNPDENGIPTEAIYAVQDFHEQKLKELENQKQQSNLLSQFYTLLQHRFVWFIECDYVEQSLRCWRVVEDTVQQTEKVSFSQMFEKLLIPYCYPDDIKKIATLFLPDAVQRAYQNGQKEIFSEYRHKTASGWKWVRVEMYLSGDNAGGLRSMTYATDIDSEKQRSDAIAQFERQQLTLRRRFGQTIQDSFLSIGEIDLDTDKIYHYQLQNHDFVKVEDPKPFSQLAVEFLETAVYPNHRQTFETMFSYEQLQRASRSNAAKIQHQFLLDMHGNHHYTWCNVAACFFRNENGKQFLMAYIQDIHAQVSEHDDTFREIEAARNKLQTNLRLAEQARIRKAHLFSNMVSDVKLSLNQVIGAFDSLHEITPQSERSKQEFVEIDSTFRRLQRMIEDSRDLLLLENDQLPLLKELTSLPQLLQKLKIQAADILYGKQLQIITYTSHVTNEHIYCDSARLAQLFDSIFLELMRSMPEKTVVTLSLSQMKYQPENQIAMYEFAMVTQGSQIGKELQTSIGEPLKNDTYKMPSERAFSADNASNHLMMHINKKLIALMHGSLSFKRSGNQTNIVTLRIPFHYASKNGECIFPQVHFYGKRALLLDSQQQSAAGISEMLAEAGIQSDWTNSFDTACTKLHDAIAQNEPYKMMIVRQADLNRDESPALQKLQGIVQDQTKIMVLCDAPQEAHTQPLPEYPVPYLVPTPLFRSILAKQLWMLYEEFKNA